MRKLQSIRDVVDWRLCIGCGACAYICPDEKIDLKDFSGEGIRPVVSDVDCGACRECLDVCPTVKTEFNALRSSPLPGDREFAKEWGPVLAMWEGHATNPEIRRMGSSGGVLTALGAYCLEILEMHGILHIGQSPDDPIRNQTRLSRKREDLLGATGSRYSPASVCNGLGLVESAPEPCAIIGRPAEIAAVKNARTLRAGLDRKVGVTMSFFCAETPSTRGTVELLKNLGVDPELVTDLRYRGNGWPGNFAPEISEEAEPCKRMTYRESWAFLQRFRPWSVQMWPDGMGELADISCGDPWYEAPNGKNPGSSLVIARTQLGREIIEGAMSAGYLSLAPAENWKLVKSQAGLLEKKGAVWGRLIAMRCFGLPTTKFKGLDLWHCWRKLSIENKLRSTVGTVRRILTRKLRDRNQFEDADGVLIELPDHKL